MNELRITPEEVYDAYWNTGIMPVVGASLYRVDDVDCGCPLTALYVAANTEHLPETGNLIEKCHLIAEWADEKYGGIYCLAFVAGVDGEHKPADIAGERAVQGWKDGEAVRYFIFNWETLKRLRG